MRYFPLFADLRGRRVLVVGGGEVAGRKARLLLEAGARVDIVARELVSHDLAEWAGAGPVSWLAREFDESQLDGATLVVAATSDGALNEQVASTARARHLLCNVVDDAERSSFIVPAIVDRSPLVIAISSGGVAPVLARLARERIEVLFDESFATLARLLAEWRSRIKHALPEVNARRRFYESLVRGRVVELVRSRRSEAAGREIERQLA